MHKGFEDIDFEEALAHLIEELGEAVAAAGKTSRFGPHSVNPLIPPKDRERNIDWLMRELADVQAAAAALSRQYMLGNVP